MTGNRVTHPLLISLSDIMIPISVAIFKVNAFVDEAILEDTTYSPILVEEFWYRENGEEHECTMR